MRSALACCLTALLLAACGGDGKKKLSGNDAHNAMLEELGVNTDVGRRTNSAGQAVPEGYNPTLRPQTILMKRDELFVAGARTHGGDATIPAPKVHGIFDWPDQATRWSPSYLTTDDAWLQLPKAAGAGDVDGDGKDEVIVAYRGPGATATSYVLTVKFLQRAAGGGFGVLHERQVQPYEGSAIDQYPQEQLWWQNFTVAAGDLDGNGKDETLVTFNGSIFLLGDSAAEFAVRKKVAYTTSGDQAYRILRAAAGDVDNDGADEFVVVESAIVKTNWWKGTCRYQILKGLDLTDVDHGLVAATDPVQAKTVALRSANVAVGDVDGDGIGEVVFGGLPEDEATYYLLVLDTAWNDDSSAFVHAFMPRFASTPARVWRDFTPPLLVADFDGSANPTTGRKANEILLLNRMYEGFGATAAGVATGAFKDKGIDLWYPNPVGNIPAYLGYAYDSNGVAGDVDGDGKTDLAYVTDSWYEVYWLGFDSAGRWTGKQHVNLWDSGVYYPIVAAGDFDGDSMRVEFVESETLFTDPHPVAVLASNPFWAGVNMAGETSIGHLKSTTEESESSVGFSVGFSVSYESEGIFDLWDVSVKASFESAFDWTASEGKTISETHSWKTFNQDTVVFTAIPYDVYYYRVVSAPDQAAVGTMLTVNLPRKPIIRPVERTWYNDRNGDAPDIEPTLLGGSIVGQPFSYPDSAAADALMAGKGLKSKTTEYVGGGGTESSIEMSIENAKGTGTNFEFEAKIESEAGAGGFKAGVSAGFRYGESYKVTSTDGTIFGGSVGGLPAADDVPAKQFRWGLFTYEAQAGTSPPFAVVQYYVEPP